MTELCNVTLLISFNSSTKSIITLRNFAFVGKMRCYRYRWTSTRVQGSRAKGPEECTGSRGMKRAGRGARGKGRGGRGAGSARAHVIAFSPLPAARARPRSLSAITTHNTPTARLMNNAQQLTLHPPWFLTWQRHNRFVSRLTINSQR